MSAQTPTSPSLLLRIRDHNDRESWQHFCDVYGPLIYGYCQISRWYSKRNRNNANSLNQNDEASDSNQDIWSEHFQQYLLEAALKVTQTYFGDQTWQAFKMVWLENQSCPEVASRMKRTLGFVYTSKSRVLKRLRFEFEQLSENTVF